MKQYETDKNMRKYKEWWNTNKSDITITLLKLVNKDLILFQVWFQNKRSKERRMKQLSHGMFPRFFGGNIFYLFEGNDIDL